MTETKLRTDLFIDGAFSPAASGRRFATVNPATGETIAEVAEAGKADLDRAVASARKAMESGPWASMKPRQRGRILTRAAEILREQLVEAGPRRRRTAHEVELLALLENPLVGDPLVPVAGGVIALRRGDRRTSHVDLEARDRGTPQEGLRERGRRARIAGRAGDEHRGNGNEEESAPKHGRAT